MTTIERSTELLTDEMLARFDERAPVYDRENRFFQEDFEELRDVGYLDRAAPASFGGAGLDLAARQPAAAPPRLRRAGDGASRSTCTSTGRASPPTCYRAGDPSCDWMLREAADGHVFAAGHGEAGNDIPLLLSTSKAERVDGGWEFTGHKIFGSLSPVWTYLGVHAMDTSDPDQPAGRPRLPGPRRAGLPHRGDLGHARACGRRRATTRSSTGRSSPTSTCRSCARPASPAPACSTSRSSPGRCSASRPSTPASPERAYDLTVERSCHQRTSIALTRSMAYHPEVQHHVAEMRIAPRDGRRATSTGRCDDWSAGVDHGMDWPVEDRRHQVHRRRRGAWSRRRHRPRPHRRRGIFKREPARAALPRRPPRPHPPRQHAAHPRARRQADPRHQPRRAAPLGLRARLGSRPPSPPCVATAPLPTQK